MAEFFVFAPTTQTQQIGGTFTENSEEGTQYVSAIIRKSLEQATPPGDIQQAVERQQLTSDPRMGQAKEEQRSSLPPPSRDHYATMSGKKKKEVFNTLEGLSHKSREEILADARSLSAADSLDRMAVLDQIALSTEYQKTYSEVQRRRMTDMAVAYAIGPEYLQKIADYSIEHERLTRLAQRPGNMMDSRVLTQRRLLEDGYEARFAFEATFAKEFVDEQNALAQSWKDNLTSEAFCAKMRQYKLELAKTSDPRKRKTLLLDIIKDITTTAGISAKGIELKPLAKGILGTANSGSHIISINADIFDVPNPNWDDLLNTIFHEGTHIMQYQNQKSPTGEFARIEANRQKALRAHLWGEDHYRWQLHENHAFYMGSQADGVHEAWKKWETQNTAQESLR